MRSHYLVAAIVALFLTTSYQISAQVLFDNGPVVTHIGTGFGGADESARQDATFGHASNGFSSVQQFGVYTADNFTIPDCEWQIDSIAVYLYQTNSDTVPTINYISAGIYDTVPFLTTAVWGGGSSNRLSKAEWSRIYRTTETNVNGNVDATSRPLMRCVINVNEQVPAGTYYFNMAAGGTLSSGPWVPPVTILGQQTTGDGILKNAAAPWEPLDDGATNDPFGMPFIIYGSISRTPPVVDILNGTEDTIICEGESVELAWTDDRVFPDFYSYQWSPTDSLSDPTGLTNAFPSQATEYVLSATSMTTGCVGYDTILVNVNPGISNVDAGLDDTICVGESRMIGGSPTASGGTPPYTYEWQSNSQIDDNTIANPTITPTSNRTYTVIVTDANGCTASDDVFTFASPLPFVNPGFFSQQCGRDTIMLGGAPTGGSIFPPITYQWSPSDSLDSDTAANPTLTTSDSGTYTVTVTDALGCVNVDSVTHNISTGVCFNIGPDTINITLGDSVVFNATPTCGEPPFIYNWDSIFCPNCRRGGLPGVPPEPPLFSCPIDSPGISCPIQTIRPSENVFITILVTGNNGCSAFQEVLILVDEPPCSEIDFFVDVEHVCNTPFATAVITNIAGGTPPYTAIWSDGIQGFNNTLSTGLFSVTVTDSIGCTGVDTFEFKSDSLIIDATVNASNCSGSATGVVGLGIIGGTGPFTYTVNGNTLINSGQRTEALTGLPSGIYQITVTDATGCIGLLTVELVATGGVTISSMVGVDLCPGDTTQGSGSITVQTTSGQPPFAYNWSTGAPISSSQLTGLSLGTYTLTVQDGNGCLVADTFEVTSPVAELRLITDTLKGPTCFGQTDGFIQLITIGGSGPYSYQWGDGPTTEDRTGLVAGTYIVTVVDGNGCTLTQTYELIGAGAPLSLNKQITIDFCEAGTGGAAITVFDGVTPYTYRWNTSAVDTGFSISNQFAGLYEVTVTDANGCTISDTMTISSTPKLITTTSTHEDTCNRGVGSAHVVPLFGSPTYEYLWSTGAITDQIFSLRSGTYTVTTTDIFQCTAIDTLIVENIGVNIVLDSVKAIQCFGDTDGAIYTSVAGGLPPYVVNWSNGASTEDITGIGGGGYTAVVTDAANCTDTLHVFVEAPVAALFGFITIDAADCGDSLGMATGSATGGLAPYTFTWDNGDVGPNADSLRGGPIELIVIDQLGCSAIVAGILPKSDTALDVTITVIPEACAGANSGSLNVTPTGGAAPYSFLWSTGSTTPFQIDNLVAGNYTVTIVDALECTIDTFATVAQAPPLELTFTAAQDTCLRGVGSATANVTGGMPPYSYIWDTPRQDSTVTASGLSSGVYRIAVLDANGCEIIDSVEIEGLNSEITLAFEEVSRDCNNDIVDVQITITGGTPPFSAQDVTYNGSVASVVGTSDPRVYIASVDLNVSINTDGLVAIFLDNNGCVGANSYEVPTSGNLSASALIETDSCASGLGSVSASGLMGTPPYSYSWSNGSATSSIMNLMAGSYGLTIIDSAGCEFDTSFTVGNIVCPNIGEPDFAKGLTIYPNPVSGNELFINFEQAPDSPLAVELYGIRGELLYSVEGVTNNTTIDVSAITSGTYIVSFSNAQSVFRKKIIVIH